tara:strand:- start:593 stop:1549 length:957 start_codon:yes stop_codon:yes gene_type:complete
MNKANRRETNIFSLSFLDIIACGFGAIILLLLIVKVGDPTVREDLSEDSLLKKLFSLQDSKVPLEESLQMLTSKLISLNAQEDLEIKKKSIEEENLNSIKNQQEAISKVIKRMTSAQQSLTETMRKLLQEQERDEEVGGIPVDSEYIIFILDNSGSMGPVWNRKNGVVEQISNILDIHPEVKGFQILNDQGKYLMQGYRKGWITDSESMRKQVLALMRNPASLGASYSNPVEGIRTAIQSHYQKGIKGSIYLFGDEIRDPLGKSLEEISKLNTDIITGDLKFRIHAIGFFTQGATRPSAHFMRQVSNMNEGTFLALPL